MLSIEEIMHALQIIHQQQHEQQKQQLQSMLFKFGEDYQNKLLMSKIRATNVESSNTSGSVGSSRRSTPSDMLSNCSTTPHSFAPNSPPTTLLTQQIPSNTFVPVQSISNIVPESEKFLQQRYEASTSLAMTPISSHSERLQQMNFAENNSVVSTSLILTETATNTHNNNNPHYHIMRSSPSTSSTVSISIRQNRAAHNELEKNRRANLRGYLDRLKSVLPIDGDSTRDTTLSMLTRARNHLRAAKKNKNELIEKKSAAIAEMIRLREELSKLSEESETNQRYMLHNNGKDFQSSDHLSGTQKIIDESAGIRENNKETRQNFGIFELPALPDLSQLKSSLQSEQQAQHQQRAITVKKAIDLYMDGLLPALPLLYPYNQLGQRHGIDSC